MVSCSWAAVWLMMTAAMSVLSLTQAIARTKRSSDFCKRNGNGMFKDPSDCSKYYLCSQGRRYHMPCPGGTEFSEAKGQCIWRRLAKCSTTDSAARTSGSDTRRRNNYRRRTTMATTMRPTTRQTYRRRTRTTRETYRQRTTTTRQTYRPTTSRPDKPRGNNKCGKLVCYFANWPQYRTGKGKHIGTDLDPHLCTHIIFAFAKLTNGQIDKFEWNDHTVNYKQVTDLKKQNPNLKVSLAIGGWTMGSRTFSAMVSSKSSRTKFIEGAIIYLRKWNFDGLDLDWEYPAHRDGSSPNDRERFTDLVRELRAAFDREATGDSRLLLTMAVPGGKPKIDKGYEVRELNKNVDFINVMAYDLTLTPTTAVHHSALYSASWQGGQTAQLNVDWILQYWVKKGADREKLILGMGTYGRTFTLANENAADNGARSTARGRQGPFSAEVGFLCYYEICTMREKPGAKKTFDEEQKVPYLSLGNQWVGYDNQKSLKGKVKYLLDEGYGGAMVWDTACDDFNNNFCGEGRYPLINAIKDACGL